MSQENEIVATEIIFPYYRVKHNHNLLVLQEFVMYVFINSSQVDCVYLDFSNAFDKVHMLVVKLAGLRISGQLLRWLYYSYLEDRELIVRCEEGTLTVPFVVLWSSSGLTSHSPGSYSHLIRKTYNRPSQTSDCVCE